MKERMVLITNLIDASFPTSFGKVRTHTNALVLFDSGTKSSGPRYRVHGFHNEAGNLTFEMVLPSFDWTVEPQPYKRSFHLVIAGDPGVRIELATDFANDEPLDIVQWKVTDANRREWSETLVRKVLRYYHAPYFIIGQQVDADQARQALGVKSVEDERLVR